MKKKIIDLIEILQLYHPQHLIFFYLSTHTWKPLISSKIRNKILG